MLFKGYLEAFLMCGQLFEQPEQIFVTFSRCKISMDFEAIWQISEWKCQPSDRALGWAKWRPKAILPAMGRSGSGKYLRRHCTTRFRVPVSTFLPIRQIEAMMIDSALSAIDPAASPPISSQPKPKGRQEHAGPFLRLDQPPMAQRQPKGRQAPQPDALSTDKSLPPQKGTVQKQMLVKPPAGSVNPAPKLKQPPAADEESPVASLSSPIARPFSHIQLVRRISSLETLDSFQKPADRERAHPALLEFQIQVATDFLLDEDNRMRRLLLMIMRQIWDRPLDNIHTHERSSLF
jgi:hypothetical protein